MTELKNIQQQRKFKILLLGDTCGAGDTFLAALCYGFLTSNDMIEAIKFANKAAAITVQHSGVYSPTLEQIAGMM